MSRTEDIRALIVRNQRNLQKLKEQKAHLGIHTPPYILVEIEDVELEIERLRLQLDSPSGQDVAQQMRLSFEPETILIPSGTFFMGGSPDDQYAADWEFPAGITNLQDYKIGKYPVTNKEYWEFVRETGHDVPNIGWSGRKPDQQKLNHPVVQISWNDALSYCQWLSEKTERKYRLPSEAEWEKAARGAEDKRIYPWGSDWDSNRCNFDGNDTSSVDAYPPQSPYGCYDMVGNVREWTTTLWGDSLDENKSIFPYPWAPDNRENLNIDDRYNQVYRIYRGGSFQDSLLQLRCSARDWYALDSRDKECGFRVVQEI